MLALHLNRPWSDRGSRGRDVLVQKLRKLRITTATSQACSWEPILPGFPVRWRRRSWRFRISWELRMNWVSSTTDSGRAVAGKQDQKRVCEHAHLDGESKVGTSTAKGAPGIRARTGGRGSRPLCPARARAYDAESQAPKSAVRHSPSGSPSAEGPAQSAESIALVTLSQLSDEGTPAATRRCPGWPECRDDHEYAGTTTALRRRAPAVGDDPGRAPATASAG